MIYAVEDDERVREMVLYVLRQTGHEARGFADAPAFWQAMKEATPSLVLLDIMLPGEDGLSILRRLRARVDGIDIPVIMLTAKGEEMDRVTGLNGGADDYVAKPFSAMELVARIEALLRRARRNETKDTLSAGRITLDAQRHRVCAEGKAVDLTAKEFELLAYLMRHLGIVCTRDNLLDAVWDSAYAGNTRTVDAHVKSLRQKLSEAGGQIETVRGVGYRFAGERP